MLTCSFFPSLNPFFWHPLINLVIAISLMDGFAGEAVHSKNTNMVMCSFKGADRNAMDNPDVNSDKKTPIALTLSSGCAGDLGSNHADEFHLIAQFDERIHLRKERSYRAQNRELRYNYVNEEDVGMTSSPSKSLNAFDLEGLEARQCTTSIEASRPQALVSEGLISVSLETELAPKELKGVDSATQAGRGPVLDAIEAIAKSKTVRSCQIVVFEETDVDGSDVFEGALWETSGLLFDASEVNIPNDDDIRTEKKHELSSLGSGTLDTDYGDVKKASNSQSVHLDQKKAHEVKLTGYALQTNLQTEHIDKEPCEALHEQYCQIKHHAHEYDRQEELGDQSSQLMEEYDFTLKRPIAEFKEVQTCKPSDVSADVASVIHAKSIADMANSSTRDASDLATSDPNASTSGAEANAEINSMDFFEAPSFMTLVEQWTQPISDAKSSCSMPGARRCTSGRKYEDVAPKLARPHVPLKTLLHDAHFQWHTRSNAKDQRAKTMTAKEQVSQTDLQKLKVHNSKMINENSERSFPASFPPAKKKRGRRLTFMTFMCFA